VPRPTAWNSESNVDARGNGLASPGGGNARHCILCRRVGGYALDGGGAADLYTANFPDATSVQLSILNNSVSRDGDYDFDVAIGLVETDANGAIRYEDTGKHRARVRCNYPAYGERGRAKISYRDASKPFRT
jgi:hypothetical protein